MSKSNPELAARGATETRVAGWLLIGLSAATIVVYVVRNGTDRLPQQLVRFLLTIGLVYALNQGRRWARWLTIFLAFLAFYLSVTQVLLLKDSLSEHLARITVFLAMAATYLWVGRLFLWSPSVSEFFRDAGKEPALKSSDMFDA